MNPKEEEKSAMAIEETVEEEGSTLYDQPRYRNWLKQQRQRQRRQ